MQQHQLSEQSAIGILPVVLEGRHQRVHGKAVKQRCGSMREGWRALQTLTTERIGLRQR
ncbi:hypothetical protein NBRC116187_32790 [Halopseudomonas sabulinigri]|uniref:Transposase n=1 Tax=Halopseudomonas sabulinigri TaxID=472181 RepID=A0ABP9ZTZ9_9GAMM